MEDVTQERLYGPLGSPETSKGVLFLVAMSSDVTFDLSGHSISNSAPVGATLVSQTLPTDEKTRQRLYSAKLVRTSVLNGTINSPFAMGTGVSFTAQGGLQRPDYLDTHHLVEKMTIYAGGAGVELKGRGNIIRNSRIVIDGPTAIDSWGPGAIIENNIIEIRPRKTSDVVWRPRELPAPDTAIRLLDGDGTVIRNNEFRFYPGFDNRPHAAAIGLTLSRDVVIEGNRFIGFEAIMARDASSTTIETGNRLVGTGQ